MRRLVAPQHRSAFRRGSHRLSLAALLAATPLPALADTAAQLAQDQRSWWLGKDGAVVAHKAGWVGTGVKVGVFDTGVSTDVAALSAPGKVTGYDVFTGKVGAQTNDYFHGTMVAGIIAAPRDGSYSEGVAPAATLYSVRIGQPDGTLNFSDAQLARGIAWASGQGVRVFNNSWGNGTPISSLNVATLNAWFGQSIAQWRAFAAKGGVTVFATGNDGLAQPGFFAALPQLYKDLQPSWLAVGSVGTTGTISSFSNRCGAAAAWCLVAPGESITAPYPYAGNRNVYATGAGTSFAAPQVTGGIALLQQEFPYLTAQQDAQILLKTANRSGIYANAAVYGQGLMDLAKATQPIGTLTVPSASGAKLASTALVLGGAFGQLKTNAAGGVQVLATDDYGRGYAVPLAARTSVAPVSFSAIDRLDQMGRAALTTRSEDGPVRSWVQLAAPDARTPSAEPGIAKGVVATDLADGGGLVVTLGKAQAAGFGPQARGILTPDSLPLVDPVSDPWLALLDQGSGVALARPAAVPGGLPATLRVGVAFGRPSLTADQLTDPTIRTTPNSVATTAELTVALGRARLSLDGGLLHEDGSLLGATGSGATRLGSADTVHAGLGWTLAIGHDSTLFAGLHAGVTSASGGAGGLVTGASGVISTSGGIGIASRGVFATADRLTVSLGQPLHVESGSLHLLLPSQQLDGSIGFAGSRAGLRADGRELALQGGWSTPLDGRTSLDAGLALRHDADNLRGSDAAVGLLSLAFRL